MVSIFAGTALDGRDGGRCVSAWSRLFKRTRYDPIHVSFFMKTALKKYGTESPRSIYPPFDTITSLTFSVFLVMVHVGHL